MRRLAIHAACVTLCLLTPALAQERGAGGANFAREQRPSEWIAGRLTGSPVVGSNGETIGVVNDVVISREGTADAIMVGMGGFLGMGERIVAVPYRDVTIGPVANNKREVRVNLSRASLENAPAYTATDPSFADRLSERASEWGNRAMELGRNASDRISEMIRDYSSSSGGDEPRRARRDERDLASPERHEDAAPEWRGERDPERRSEVFPEARRERFSERRDEGPYDRRGDFSEPSRGDFSERSRGPYGSGRAFSDGRLAEREEDDFSRRRVEGPATKRRSGVRDPRRDEAARTGEDDFRDGRADDYASRRDGRFPDRRADRSSARRGEFSSRGGRERRPDIRDDDFGGPDRDADIARGRGRDALSDPDVEDYPDRRFDRGRDRRSQLDQDSRTQSYSSRR